MDAQNGTIHSGEDVTITIALTDNAGTALTGAQVDAITEYQYVIAADPYAKNTLISKTVGSGVTLSNTAFTATVALADTDTDTLKGTYYHFAKATDSTGAETLSLYGRLTILENPL